MQNYEISGAFRQEQIRAREQRPDSLSGSFWRALLSSFAALVGAVGGRVEVLSSGLGSSSAGTNTIAPSKFADILEKAALQLRCSDLGLRLAERLSTPNGPILHQSATWNISQSNFDRRVLWLARQFPNVQIRTEWLASRKMKVVSIDAIPNRRPALPQMTEFLMLLAYSNLLSSSMRPGGERHICFSHQQIGNKLSYAQRFHTVPEFERQSNSLVFRAERFGVAVNKDDEPPLRGKEAHTFAFDEQVRAAIKHTLARSECDRKQVATFLHLNTRTLQRRLRRIGLSFESLRDEVRRDLALSYLAESTMPVTEISGRLGYSEPAVLSRSCRRWFAATPSQLRRLSSVK